MQLEDPRIRYKQLQNERCSTESIPLQEMALLHSQKTASTQTPRLGYNNNIPRRSIQETSFSSNHFDTDAVIQKIQNMFPTASENHIRLLLKRYYNREAVVISALQVEKHPVTMPGPFVTPPTQRHLYHSNSAFHITPPSRRLDILGGGGGGGHSLASSASAFGGRMGTSRTASPLPAGRICGGIINSNSQSTAGDGGTFAIGHFGHHSGGGGGALSCPATSSLLYYGSTRFDEQWPSTPKPRSSPKMKLRYMKNIFPKADEMLLLDVLAGEDNNVQKASSTLITMGYAKRDVVTQKPNNPTKGSNAQNDDEKKNQIIPLRPKEYTQEEKIAIQQCFKEKFAQIAERIIVMALESVNYSEERAKKILKIVQEEEDVQRAKDISNCIEAAAAAAAADVATDINITTTAHVSNGGAQQESSVLKACNEWKENQVRNVVPPKDNEKPSKADEVDSQQQKEFKSILAGRTKPLGRNTELSKGPDESLLLADYVTWNGPNPDISSGGGGGGQRQLAVGANSNLLTKRSYVSHGHNIALCKGPNVSNAKGSIYAKLTADRSSKNSNIKCN